MAFGPRHQHCFGCFNSALSQLICCSLTLDLSLCRNTCREMNSDYKKEKTFQFQPKNFHNHTFKAAKISERDSYPSPITTECPESKTCYQPPQFQLFCPFPVTDFPLAETVLQCHSWNITYREPSFRRSKIWNCWNASPSTFSPWEDCKSWVSAIKLQIFI